MNDTPRGKIQTATEALESAEDAPAMTPEKKGEFAKLLKKDIAFGERGIHFEGFEDAWRYCKMIASSKLGGGDSPQDILAKIQRGMELGMPPMMAHEHVYLIPQPGGKVKTSVSVEGLTAIVESKRALAPGTKIEVIFSGEPRTDKWQCIAKSTPRGASKPIESPPVLWGDFKHLHTEKNKYGNVKENWARYPARMMKARAVGYHVRDFYPAHAGGISCDEELRDYMASARPHGSPLDNAPAYDAATDPLVGWMSGKTPEPTRTTDPEPESLDDFVAAYESKESE